MFKDPFTIWLRLCLGASLVGLLSVRSASAQAGTVTIEFRVTVPKDTPADATVYLAGNQQAAGRWAPGAVPLQARDDGRWGTKLQLPKGETLEYKFTLGSWTRVEKGKDGAEIANRVLRLEGDGTVEITVGRWADASGSLAAAKHNESYWSQRVDRMLIYFFGTTSTGDTGMQTLLTIEPSKENPRNSEGDIIELKDGRLCLIYTRFTGGGGDDAAADLAMRLSPNRGRTWSDDKIVVRHTGGLNVMSVSLLRLATGEIALFYLRKTSQEDCRPRLCLSTDEAQTWSEPTVCITDEVGYYVLNNDRAVQLHSGRLVLPVAWHQGPGRKRDTAGVIMCYLSDDHGKTWRRSKDSFQGYAPGGQRITVQEPGVVELKDGRLLMYIRTDAGSQYICHSPDGGETWSNAVPSALASPLSPATIKRIPWTGDLVCVWNDHSGAHPYPAGRRTPLCLAISKDEGRSWSRSRILEGYPDGWYCYTSITFLEDRLLLAYCAGDKQVGGLNRLKVLALSKDRLAPSSLTPDAKAGME